MRPKQDNLGLPSCPNLIQFNMNGESPLRKNSKISPEQWQILNLIEEHSVRIEIVIERFPSAAAIVQCLRQVQRNPYPHRPTQRLSIPCHKSYIIMTMKTPSNYILNLPLFSSHTSERCIHRPLPLKTILKPPITIFQRLSGRLIRMQTTSAKTTLI